MAWHDVGEWVRVNPSTVDTYVLRDEGPFQITAYEESDRIVRLDAVGRNGTRFWFWVSLRHCIPSQPPRISFVERERAVLEAEGWRKRRDENLAKAFRPEREVYPTDAPDPKPVATKTPGDKASFKFNGVDFILVSD